MIKCKKCNYRVERNAKFCANCGAKISYINNEYNGLSGWLILIAIGLLLSPLVKLIDFTNTYLPIFKNGTWETISNPNSEAYNNAFSILLISEVAFNLIIITISFYMVYLFFAKKRLFPIFYIWTLLVSLIFIIVDSLLVSSIFPSINPFDVKTLSDFFRVLIWSLIWIPYMLKSKRVQATFRK